MVAIHFTGGKKDALHTKQIKKGMVLVSNPTTGKSGENGDGKPCEKFQAEIRVLHHATTIKNNYQPVIHCGTIRQSASILMEEEHLLRTGDTAKVTFQFLFRPEFIRVGQPFFFRDGGTRGIGKVIGLGAIATSGTVGETGEEQ